MVNMKKNLSCGEMWRQICHVEKFFHMTDCHVEKDHHMKNCQLENVST